MASSDWHRSKLTLSALLEVDCSIEWPQGDHSGGLAIIQLREHRGLDQGVNHLDVGGTMREELVGHQGSWSQQLEE